MAAEAGDGEFSRDQATLTACELEDGAQDRSLLPLRSRPKAAARGRSALDSPSMLDAALPACAKYRFGIALSTIGILVVAVASLAVSLNSRSCGADCSPMAAEGACQDLAPAAVPTSSAQSQAFSISTGAPAFATSETPATSYAPGSPPLARRAAPEKPLVFRCARGAPPAPYPASRTSYEPESAPNVPEMTDVGPYFISADQVRQMRNTPIPALREVSIELCVRDPDARPANPYDGLDLRAETLDSKIRTEIKHDCSTGECRTLFSFVPLVSGRLHLEAYIKLDVVKQPRRVFGYLRSDLTSVPIIQGFPVMMLVVPPSSWASQFASRKQENGIACFASQPLTLLAKPSRPLPPPQAPPSRSNRVLRPLPRLLGSGSRIVVLENLQFEAPAILSGVSKGSEPPLACTEVFIVRRVDSVYGLVGVLPISEAAAGEDDSPAPGLQEDADAVSRFVAVAPGDFLGFPESCMPAGGESASKFPALEESCLTKRTVCASAPSEWTGRGQCGSLRFHGVRSSEDRVDWPDCAAVEVSSTPTTSLVGSFLWLGDGPCRNGWCIGHVGRFRAKGWAFVPSRNRCVIRTLESDQIASCLQRGKIGLFISGDSNGRDHGRSLAQLARNDLEWEANRDQLGREYQVLNASAHVAIQSHFNGGATAGTDGGGMKQAFSSKPYLERFRASVDGLFSKAQAEQGVIFLNTGQHDMYTHSDWHLTFEERIRNGLLPLYTATCNYLKTTYNLTRTRVLWKSGAASSGRMDQGGYADNVKKRMIEGMFAREWEASMAVQPAWWFDFDALAFKNSAPPGYLDPTSAEYRGCDWEFVDFYSFSWPFHWSLKYSDGSHYGRQAGFRDRFAEEGVVPQYDDMVEKAFGMTLMSTHLCRGLVSDS